MVPTAQDIRLKKNKDLDKYLLDMECEEFEEETAEEETKTD